MAQSSMFTEVRVTDFSGTVQDLSPYIQDCPAFGHEANSTDVTTLALGGGFVTHGSVRGALKSEVTITFLLCPALMLILCPLLGNNTGYLWEQLQGTNATPTFGDEWIGGTYTLFNLRIDTSSTATGPMTVKGDIKISDGAAVLPTRNKLGA